MSSLPTDAKARKASPLAEGLLWYFPNALAAVAAVSKVGNDQHNPGQPMHHSRGKSSDHADCILRHLIDAGTLDSDGVPHTAKVAWRALAMLQEEEERRHGYPLPRNAKAPIDHTELVAGAIKRFDEFQRKVHEHSYAVREAATSALHGNCVHWNQYYAPGSLVGTCKDCGATLTLHPVSQTTGD